MNEEKNIVPPHSIEAEKACIGSILIDPGYSISEIADILTPEDFYSARHQVIFKNLIELYNNNQPIDILTLTEKLKTNNQLEICGGTSYIASLTTYVPTSANIKHYAKIVKNKSQLRALMDIANKIYQMATEDNDEVESIIDYAEHLIFSVAENRKSGNLIDIKSLLEKAIDIIDARIRNKGVYTGIPTGFKDLDDITYGFHPSDLIIIAARPSMGKTSFALNIAANMATKYKKSVLIFSLEMSSEQLVQRILSSEARVDSVKIRSGILQKSDWQNILRAVDNLNNSKIWIEATPALSYTEMRAIARRLKSKEQLDVIIVDYLQLIGNPHGQKFENRQTAVSEISRNLKIIARELNVPVIALSQLSREVEKRSDKEPVLSDLRESGAIEQDADIVAFIHRPGYYNKDEDDRITEVIIAKHRNGPTGKVKLVFFNEYTKFEDYISEEKINIT
ncbi:MAG TPA: replicative DNA helicase [Spirochaetota bacterium]|nr:replicative DNA helicase [Spirochaetota bacterium]HOM38857.1 replicative DNA helicase [Spirochaetota bacterium]HPQ49152.1 replicative DNA helicase [Spirochaetota bacterium]